VPIVSARFVLWLSRQAAAGAWGRWGPQLSAVLLTVLVTVVVTPSLWAQPVSVVDEKPMGEVELPGLRSARTATLRFPRFD
jgi:hypothetical protein